MDPTFYQIFDFARIGIGKVPLSFLAEAVLRASFLYFLIMVAMRIMGKRMVSRMSRSELAALVSLAAAIGIPMQDPSKGLVPAALITAVVISIERLVASFSIKSPKFETLVQGELDTLVVDGKLNLSNLKRTLVSSQKLMSELRSNGIDNLGKVQRAFMEPSGSFSVFEFEEEKVGLSILPDFDQSFREEQRKAPHAEACTVCGNVRDVTASPKQVPCERCRSSSWTTAVIS